ncbi:DUF6059 family protein [Streptomyces candidus]|uniref:Phenylpropionate dioxygenase-like ring-hydroxylating dioxygenase large terminal subunit n=1 Tax=Streptomyces candidus TaxID=67283 RepID=A0A7X0LQ71_9ACTN|nr:DUF6059 family protein [Streptomyces candidus]MBB6436722.1 phenylpropionate dioxygenase-like ring-hydroxylating dioxygenase large terminal subunit [Streptomyces candidus]GHH51194.1 hypothetical protein GCM10018773_49350 [Streptomyces candidus]
MTAVRRLLRAGFRTLSAAGLMWLGLAAEPPDPAAQAPPELRPPPAGHPERLCPDVPLSATERALDRQLH